MFAVYTINVTELSRDPGTMFEASASQQVQILQSSSPYKVDKFCGSRDDEWETIGNTLSSD